MCKIILNYFYVDVPKKVRIVSKKMCLDHTFDTGPTFYPLGYDDLSKMAEDDLYDEIWFMPHKGLCFRSPIVPEDYEEPELLFLEENWYNSANFELKLVDKFPEGLKWKKTPQEGDNYD